jgi:hypothetical protein
MNPLSVPNIVASVCRPVKASTGSGGRRHKEQMRQTLKLPGLLGVFVLTVVEMAKWPLHKLRRNNELLQSD